MQPRLSNGRFTFTKQQQVIAAKAVTINFRAGSLYRITGGPVARFVAVNTTKRGQIATLTVHGKPIAVNVDRVRKADKEDVNAYLADVVK